MLSKRKNALEKEMEKRTIFRRKIFNLDGPDRFQYYFHDTRKETMSAIRRQMEEGSAMVWAGIGYFGKTSIKFINGRINSVRYMNLIKEQKNMQDAFLDLITSFNKIMHLYTHQNWSNRTLIKIIYLFCRGLHAPRNLILLKIAGQILFTAYTRMESGINTYNN